MKKFKILAESLLIVVVVVAIMMGVFTTSATSTDPADNYVKQTAPNEDSSIKMWFDYSFRKTLTEDKTPTGMDTFSIYMAKNEIESAQFVLYSDTDKTGMSATVTDFTDGNGNTIPAEIYYQFYVTVTNVDSQTVWGENYIREGEIPDPVAPLAKLKTFKLNGGKSQAFLIRAKSASDTAPGWYSAQLNVYDANKQTVKTATVYCHVWDFEISEKTELKTALFMANDTTYQGNYKVFYDYLLENRLNAMDVPSGRPTSTNEYLTNPRVAAFRITSLGASTVGANGGYMECTNFKDYSAIHDELSTSPVWNDIKDKLYFYATDEPLPYDLVGTSRQTVNDAKYNTTAIRTYWGEDIKSVVTPCEDHAYPYSTFTQPLTNYPQEQLKDADQEMMDTDAMTVICPRIYAFTPYEELLNYGNIKGTVPVGANPFAENIACIRNAAIGGYSGFYGIFGKMGAVGFYDWTAMYGDKYDRYMSYITTKNSTGDKSVDYELWAYSAGMNKSYTYTNHVIENTGLQTKMMFWQLYQNDCTGYLYYATNGWRENPSPAIDTTVTGAKSNCTWYLNRLAIAAGTETKYIYGNGVLFYGPSMGKVSGVSVIGSLRVEIMRDGVEEYQMFKMLEGLKGENRAKEIVGEVSTNVVRYLSLSGFDRSAFSSSMDEYDIMEAVRRQLGNEVEAATLEGQCEHTWNSGVVTKTEGCLTVGEKTFTCTTCGAQRTEAIPTKHDQGNCFEKVSGTAATCTEAGSEVYRCTICGYKKTVNTLSHHNNIDMFDIRVRDDKFHSNYCSVCGELVSNGAHTMFRHKDVATCEEAGRLYSSCSVCGYEETIEEYPAIGHNYVDGICTNCGDGVPTPPEPEYVLGDANNDGFVNAMDANLLKKHLGGSATLVDTALLAVDVNEDGNVNAMDANLLKKYLSGSIGSLGK